MRDHSCPLCGHIMHFSERLSRHERRPWYSEVRGLYKSDSFRSVRLTGLGFIVGHSLSPSHTHALFAPIESDSSYFRNNMVNLRNMRLWKICDPAFGNWCFCFHNVCWELLALRLGSGQMNPLQHRSVFYQLYCTPCHGGSWSQLGHDVGPFYGQSLNTSATNWDLLRAADPSEIYPIKDLESTSNGNLEPSSLEPSLSEATRILSRYRTLQEDSERSQAKKRPPAHCIFDELSAELRFEIFSYLAFEEVLNLRLVCRSLALAAAVGALPRAYWRSRFLPGQDAAFIAMPFNKSQDWARLFMWIKVCCKNTTSNVGTRNRIWNWLEPIAALAQMENKLSGPHGSIYYGDESNLGGFRGHLDLSVNHKYAPPNLQMRKLFSGSVSALLTQRPSCGPLREGCRALYHRARSLVPPDEANEPIGISIVQLSGRKFIAGILFPGPENNATDRAIGFHIPSSQKLVNVPHNTGLRAIWVAFIPEGLTGIKFVFKDRSSSDWVGETNYPGTVFGTLSIHDGPDWPYLLAGLDYFKIVSLGLSKIEGCPADDVPDISALSYTRPHYLGNILNDSGLRSQNCLGGPPGRRRGSGNLSVAHAPSVFVKLSYKIFA